MCIPWVTSWRKNYDSINNDEFNEVFFYLGNWKQQSSLGGKYGNAVQPLFEKCLSLFKKAFLNQKKGCLFHSHFLKKPISLFKKGYLNHRKKAFLHNKKRFSREKKVIKKRRKEMLFYTPKILLMNIVTNYSQLPCYAP